MRDAREVLGDVEDAARRKVDSMLAPSSSAADDLRVAVQARLPEMKLDPVLDLSRHLGGKKSARAMDAYLSHPYRIATIIASMAEPLTPEIVTIAILHNVYEVSDATEDVLVSRGVSETAARAIRLLTIDRAREADAEYLARFYGAIEDHGPPLALVRTIDKLDNVLGLALLDDGPVKTSYIDLAEQFVGPIAERLDRRLGAYFAEAIGLARRTPCDTVRYAEYLAITEGA